MPIPSQLTNLKLKQFGSVVAVAVRCCAPYDDRFHFRCFPEGYGTKQLVW